MAMLTNSGSESANACLDSVFLIGGGPSLRGMPLDLLARRATIAINDVGVHVPWATALFSLDPDWIVHRRSFVAAFKGERYLAAPAHIPRDIPGVTYMDRMEAVGLSDDPRTIHNGGTSGYGALNLAYLKGAKFIVLLGYDYCTVDGRRHWYDGETSSSWDQAVLDQWAAAFRSTTAQLRAKGVTVVNASPISRVDAFPKLSLEWLFRALENDDELELLRRSYQQLC
jgi:hypothetical protein